MTLNLASILAAKDREIITVDCPEWGGAVLMLPFSGNDRDWYDQFQSEKRWPGADEEADWRGLRAGAVARALCDANGVKQPATDEQVLALGDKNGAALDRCFCALRDASGLGPKAADDAKKN